MGSSTRMGRLLSARIGRLHILHNWEGAGMILEKVPERQHFFRICSLTHQKNFAYNSLNFPKMKIINIYQGWADHGGGVQWATASNAQQVLITGFLEIIKSISFEPLPPLYWMSYFSEEAQIPRPIQAKVVLYWKLRNPLLEKKRFLRPFIQRLISAQLSHQSKAQTCQQEEMGKSEVTRFTSTFYQPGAHFLGNICFSLYISVVLAGHWKWRRIQTVGLTTSICLRVGFVTRLRIIT